MPIKKPENIARIGDVPVHAVPCLGEFEEWTETEVEPETPTDDTPVCFEGEMCRWGDLMVQDRKVIEMMADGSLVGAYPF